MTEYDAYRRVQSDSSEASREAVADLVSLKDFFEHELQCNQTEESRNMTDEAYLLAQ